jgi:hypothetical protein
MPKVVVIMLSLCALALAVGAEKKIKPWTEWSEKDALKMLNDSAWGQTQTETNTSEMFYSPTARGGSGGRNTGGAGSDSNDRSSQGALNQATNINYRIRLLSARPIRQAFARLLILKNPQMTEQLRTFAEQKTDQYIVIAVDFDSTDRRFLGPAQQVFNSANDGVLKNNTYLEVKSGERIFLQQYRAPINDGMGAKFIFPRLVNNEPFVSADSGYLRFYSEVSKEIRLNMRFKVSDLIYDGQLEY